MAGLGQWLLCPCHMSILMARGGQAGARCSACPMLSLWVCLSGSLCALGLILQREMSVLSAGLAVRARPCAACMLCVRGSWKHCPGLPTWTLP